MVAKGEQLARQGWQQLGQSVDVGIPWGLDRGQRATVSPHQVAGRDSGTWEEVQGDRLSAGYVQYTQDIHLKV